MYSFIESRSFIIQGIEVSPIVLFSFHRNLSVTFGGGCFDFLRKRGINDQAAVLFQHRANLFCVSFRRKRVLVAEFSALFDATATVFFDFALCADENFAVFYGDFDVFGFEVVEMLLKVELQTVDAFTRGQLCFKRFRKRR